MSAVGIVDDMGELTEQIADTHCGRSLSIASFAKALFRPRIHKRRSHIESSG